MQRKTCWAWALVLVVACSGAAVAQRVRPIQQEELDYQAQAYQQWWNAEWERKLENLPTKGAVPDYRIPYSGHDYPDRGGGTVRAMAKYDYAFHNGRMLATEWERRDVRNGRPDFSGRPLLRLFAGRRNRVPGWYGHCNGWTAAAIRHAEPQHSVVRNGVTFTPADIKGLLAEIYMYNDSEFLGGIDPVINAGTLHLTFANWLGRGDHPIGMETALGEVVFNYPAYRYEAKVNKVSDRAYEVEMTVTYAISTNYEMDQSPRLSKQMYFHYLLGLDDEGRIMGGSYYGDSARIDMLWAPLNPVQAGEKGNERGNPYLDVKEVLAIWRESVPEELRKKWWNIDPAEEDRILDEEESEDADVASTDASDDSNNASASESDEESRGTSGDGDGTVASPASTASDGDI